MSTKKVVLIVGMGGRRDAALARVLLEEGMAVELLLHGGKSALDIPSQVHTGPIDLTDESNIEAAVQAVATRQEKLDALIVCPDFCLQGALAETSSNDWEECIALNLTSVFMICKHVVPVMIKQGAGRVINVSSDAGRMGVLNGAAYAAAKAGVMTFSKALAREMAAHGITVNVVSLGMIEGEVQALGAETDLSGVLLKRAGRWEEVAQAVLGLLHNRSGYLTGQTIHVNGGLYMP